MKQSAQQEVLFQKLGNKWYIFSEVEGDIIYSCLPDGMSPHSTKLELYHVIENHLNKLGRGANRNVESAA